MAKLQTIEKIVLEVLEQSKSARRDDHILMYLVCEKINPALNSIPYGIVTFHHNEYGLPNWKSVERARRKIQRQRPDLVEPKTAKIRRKEEEEYREYSHT